MDDLQMMLKKAEYETELRIINANKRIEQELENWIKKGKNYIYPEKYQEWDECIRSFTDKSRYNENMLVNNVSTIDIVLSILEKLNVENVNDVANEFNKSMYPITVLEFARIITLRFADNGPDFYELTNYRIISSEEENMIDEYRNRNEELETLHKMNNINKMK